MRSPRGGFPRGSWALALLGGREISISTGVTNPEDGRKLTPKDRLLSGSIGKTYVAAMALEVEKNANGAVSRRTAKSDRRVTLFASMMSRAPNWMISLSLDWRPGEGPTGARCSPCRGRPWDTEIDGVVGSRP